MFVCLRLGFGDQAPCFGHCYGGHGAAARTPCRRCRRCHCSCFTCVLHVLHGRGRLLQLLFPFGFVLGPCTLNLGCLADGEFGLPCASTAPCVPTFCFCPPSVVAVFAAALEPWLFLPIGSAFMFNPSILLAVEPLPSVLRWLCLIIHGSLTIGTLTVGVVRLLLIIAYRSLLLLLLSLPFYRYCYRHRFYY